MARNRLRSTDCRLPFALRGGSKGAFAPRWPPQTEESDQNSAFAFPRFFRSRGQQKKAQPGPLLFGKRRLRLCLQLTGPKSCSLRSAGGACLQGSRGSQTLVRDARHDECIDQTHPPLQACAAGSTWRDYADCIMIFRMAPQPVAPSRPIPVMITPQQSSPKTSATLCISTSTDGL